MENYNLELGNTQELNDVELQNISGGEYDPQSHAGYYWSAAFGLGAVWVTAYTIGYYN
ncbi:MAG: hypothetical protein ABFS35_20895 [Bacteroidota bacterium]